MPPSPLVFDGYSERNNKTSRKSRIRSPTTIKDQCFSRVVYGLGRAALFCSLTSGGGRSHSVKGFPFRSFAWPKLREFCAECYHDVLPLAPPKSLTEKA